MRKTLKRLVLAMSVGLTAVIAPASVVQADSLIDFKCSTVTWKGSIMPTVDPGYADDYSQGTLKHCITVTKKSDSNASYNFYEVRMQDEWTVTNNGGWPDNKAYGFISSTVSATDYMATPTVTSDHACFDAMAFSFSWHGFGISIRPEVCRDNTIRRVAQYPSIVHWDTVNVVKTHLWDEVFFVKVSQSSRPTFRAAMNYPWYTRTYDYDCEWKNGKVFRQVSLSVAT
jgi:hypothetical protein